MIENCAFGTIVVDGKKYSSDMIIYPDRHVEDGWCRKSGHRLSKDDLCKLIKCGPKVIVAGTGMFGRMKPEKELEDFFREKEIMFISEPNRNAMETYNKLLSTMSKVSACFHLTC